VFNLGSTSIIYTTHSRYITQWALSPIRRRRGVVFTNVARVSGTIHNAYYSYTVLYMSRYFAFAFIIIFSFHRIVDTQYCKRLRVRLYTYTVRKRHTKVYVFAHALEPYEIDNRSATLTCVQFDHVHYTLRKTCKHIHDVNMTFWPFNGFVHMIIIRARNILFEWHSKIQFLCTWRAKARPLS